jgi:hypothetical protein
MRSFVALLVLLTVTAAAQAEDLNGFLKAATVAARPTAPVRADGELVTASPDGTVRDQLVVIRRPNGDAYYELRSSGIRALLLANPGEALMVPAKNKRPEPFALDAPLDGSEFTREDLAPFTVDAYRSPGIADRSPDEMTVSLTPHPSQYALQVITFDRDKKVAAVVKYYKDSASNLVKLRRNGGWTSVGGIWLPTEISMENFPMRVSSTVTLRWQPTEDNPALFDPASLDKPSALTWPAP